MTNCSLLLTASLLLFFTTNVSFCRPEGFTAVKYLQKYGYLGKSEGRVMSETVYVSAIQDFQRFAGLNASGKLDKETVKLMTSPRCGNPDVFNQSEHAKRRKRFVHHGSKWPNLAISYRIKTYSNKFDQATIERQISRAFKLWSDVTPLTFIHKTTRDVDIDIEFVKGEHGDGDPLDGPGNTLAHAFFPIYGGDVHFDDEERWTIEGASGTNLFQVAAHEFGHSLGLSHSSEREALMWPYYKNYKPEFKLHKDDVLGIQSLYGGSNDLCTDPRMDVIIQIANGNTYVFKGDYYWKLDGSGLVEGYPRLISADWGGLPGNLNAAFNSRNGKTYFFKGDKYWIFSNMKMDDGPKDIAFGFPAMPANVDAVINWRVNGKTYFFKDDGYWRFEDSKEFQYPLSIGSEWKGIPNDLDSAFTYNNKTYFFKGEEYFRLNDITSEVDTMEAYPRKTAIWWYGCNNLCKNPKMDAITRIANGNTYVFKGDYYWKLEDSGLADGYPRLISEDWDGLPGNLNAALNWRNGTTYFFKNDRYWSFRDMKMDKGYPKDIAAGFPGMPENVDAVLNWRANGKTYFFKGDSYWRFEDSKEFEYPLPIHSEWKGVPNNLDAAFTYDNKTYFFKGEDYLRLNDATSDVDTTETFPRKITLWWYGCKV